MTDRAHVLERAQVGIEATPGTSVTAATNVRSATIDIDVAGDNEFFRPDGHKANAIVIPNMEWTTWQLNGKPTYTEMCLFLANILGSPTTTTVGSTGRQRVYDMLDTAADARKTLTIQKGSAARAHALTYGLLTDYTLVFSRKNGVTISGSGIGQLLTDGVSLDSATDLALVPIASKQLSLFIDDSWADLGTTQMLRAFNVQFQQQGLWGPVWSIDSTQTSFAGDVPLAGANTCTIRLEADAAGMAYLSQYRAGDTIFVRLEADGPQFEAGTPNIDYSLLYDVCLGLKSPNNLGTDEDGVTAVDWQCEFVQDSTAGKSVEVTVVNDVTSGV